MVCGKSDDPPSNFLFLVALVLGHGYDAAITLSSSSWAWLLPHTDGSSLLLTHPATKQRVTHPHSPPSPPHAVVQCSFRSNTSDVEKF